MEIGGKIKKLSWKYKIVSGIVSGLMFAGTLYLIDDEIRTANYYLFQGVFFGFFMGVGFPFLTDKFANRITSKIGKNITPKLEDNEHVDVKGPANLFRGIEGVGGKIFLTNKKFIFKSHKINIQKGQTEIKYDDIKEIQKRKTAKLINNGIRIITVEGTEYNFVVNERDTWIEKLNEKIR